MIQPSALKPRDSAASLAGATVCGTGTQLLPGDGIWTLAGHRALTAAQTAALVTALSARNVPLDPAAICTAQAVLVPDFTLTLADASA